mmetsp:Transcript_34176/g.79439  ORF Transcript_34176/g.79439 Transcript_34176/m.79439 type:complete len:232 (+) Transcript_34176:471-1166(+)
MATAQRVDVHSISAHKDHLAQQDTNLGELQKIPHTTSRLEAVHEAPRHLAVRDVFLLHACQVRELLAALLKHLHKKRPLQVRRRGHILHPRVPRRRQLVGPLQQTTVTIPQEQVHARRVGLLEPHQRFKEAERPLTLLKRVTGVDEVPFLSEFELELVTTPAFRVRHVLGKIEALRAIHVLAEFIEAAMQVSDDSHALYHGVVVDGLYIVDLHLIAGAQLGARSILAHAEH